MNRRLRSPTFVPGALAATLLATFGAAAATLAPGGETRALLVATEPASYATADAIRQLVERRYLIAEGRLVDLRGETATGTNIVAALDALAKSTTTRDRVIVVVLGRTEPLLSRDTLRTHDFSPARPESGVPISRIDAEFTRIAADFSVRVLPSCLEPGVAGSAQVDPTALGRRRVAVYYCAQGVDPFASMLRALANESAARPISVSRLVKAWQDAAGAAVSVTLQPAYRDQDDLDLQGTSTAANDESRIRDASLTLAERAQPIIALGRVAAARDDERPAIVGRLAALANDADLPPILRDQALRELARIDDPAAARALVDTAGSADDARLRATAARSAGALADNAPAEALLELLDSEDDPHVRAAIVRALDERPDAFSTERLAALARQPSTLEVQRAAWQALNARAAARPEARAALVEVAIALTASATASLRASAAVALGRLGVTESRVVERLVRIATADAEPDARASALHALGLPEGWIGNAKIATVLLAAARDGSTIDERQAAIWSYVRIAPAEAAAALEAMASERARDDATRATALEALQEVPGASSAVVARLTRAPEPALVRSTALMTLATHADGAAVDAVLAATRDPDAAIASVGRETLDQMASDAPALLSWARDAASSPDERTRALRALARSTTPRARDLLIEALAADAGRDANTPDLALRAAAVQAVRAERPATLATPEGVAALAQRVEPTVAVQVLAAYETPAAQAVLRKGVDEARGQTRVLAIEGLDPRVDASRDKLENLALGAGPEDSPYASTAVGVLSNAGDPEARRVLDRVANDRSVPLEVRWKAADSVRDIGAKVDRSPK